MPAAAELVGERAQAGVAERRVAAADEDRSPRSDAVGVDPAPGAAGSDVVERRRRRRSAAAPSRS